MIFSFSEDVQVFTLVAFLLIFAILVLVTLFSLPFLITDYCNRYNKEFITLLAELTVKQRLSIVGWILAGTLGMVGIPAILSIIIGVTLNTFM